MINMTVAKKVVSIIYTTKFDFGTFLELEGSNLVDPNN